MIKSLILSLCIFFLAACGGEVELQRIPANGTILAFGDSLTAGNGALSDESYPALLASLSGRNVVNAGISGEVTAEGLGRLPALLDEYRPRLLILCHGGNDLLRRLSPEQAESNIREMISMAQTRDIPVLLLGVPRPGIFLSSADMYQIIAEDTGVVFMPGIIPDVLSDRGLKSDRIHPNAQGYSVIAGEIFTLLQKAGAL